MSITQDRNHQHAARVLTRKEAARRAKDLAQRRWNNSQIAAWMGLSESTVRALLIEK